MKRLFTLAALLGLAACTGAPAGIEPVTGFEPQRYLGRWYEIARLDHSFERGLSSVTADYSARDDGGIAVRNRGFSAQEQAWSEAEGRAYFVAARDTGHLKVSFFGPFYGAYVIFELERENYDYAFVSGPDRSYLWLLARSPDPGDAVVQRFVARARQLGFDTDALIFPAHEPAHERSRASLGSDGDDGSGIDGKQH